MSALSFSPSAVAAAPLLAADRALRIANVQCPAVDRALRRAMAQRPPEVNHALRRATVQCPALDRGPRPVTMQCPALDRALRRAMAQRCQPRRRPFVESNTSHAHALFIFRHTSPTATAGAHSPAEA